MDIKELEEGFKDLQTYSDSQFKTISELNREISKLKAENFSMQKMMEGNLPSLEFKNGHIGISNEQLICESQICLLKERAMKQELNADETRRFAIYVDVLEKLNKNGGKEDMSLKTLDTDAILKLVGNNEPTTNK